MLSFDRISDEHFLSYAYITCNLGQNKVKTYIYQTK